jgi:hypothetical protein
MLAKIDLLFRHRHMRVNLFNRTQKAMTGFCLTGDSQGSNTLEQTEKGLSNNLKLRVSSEDAKSINCGEVVGRSK